MRPMTKRAMVDTSDALEVSSKAPVVPCPSRPPLATVWRVLVVAVALVTVLKVVVIMVVVMMVVVLVVAVVVFVAVVRVVLM